REEIENALRKADCVLFLASQHFVEREHIKWTEEVIYARINHTLLTVFIEPLKKKLPADIGEFQWAKLYREVDGGALSEDQLEKKLDLLEYEIKKKFKERRER